MPRATRTFEKSGFEVIPSTSGMNVVDFNQSLILDWWPSVTNLKMSEAVIREKIGLMVYWLRGWA